MAFGVLGLSPAVFWDMTYHEFCLALDGYNKRLEQEIGNNWQTAQLTAIGFHSPKKFPDLKKLLKPKHIDPSKREEAKAWLDKLPKVRKKKNGV